jgi:hypothetical protein
MSAKRFSAIIIQPGTDTILMTGATNTDSTATVVLTNQGTQSTNIFLAYMDSTNLNDLSPEDFIIYNKQLGPGSYHELKGLVIEEGHSIVVRSSITPVSVMAYGFSDPKN